MIAIKILITFTLVSVGFFQAAPLNAQVYRPELENLGPVVFINHEGPPSRIDTRAQIREIGYGLGRAVNAGATRPGALGRYFVIRARGEPDGFRLDADILGFGPDVMVDHIRNIRLILQGYLEAAFGYSERDAALLAELITIYNAVYRGDLDFFSTRFRPPVMQHLTRERAGLSIRFDEWPGQTLMLIPLGTGLGGPLSAVDTATIIDPRVIEHLRQDPDMGLDQRRDMVDLLEREAEQAEQQAQITREAVQQEEQRIREELLLLEEQQRQAREEERRIAEERQQPGADQEALDERQLIVLEQQQEAQQRQDELAQQQEALDELRQEAERQEAFAEQRADEAQQQRELIAEDQQILIDQEPPPVVARGVLGVTITSPNSFLGRIVHFEPETGRELLRSPINTVHVRSVALLNNRIFAIAGENRGGSAIRLVEINPDTLLMQRQGDNDIAEQSFLWVNGQDLYALIQTDGNFHMARFNTDLQLQSRSSVNVHPFASLLFYNGVIITQRSDGSPLHLNPRDLTESR